MMGEAAMPSTIDRTTSRRRFLGFLAASPLISAGGLSALAQTPSSPHRLPDPMLWAPRDLENLIATPKEAINVFDFEPVARNHVPPAHFGYMVAGVDDEVTLRANREGFLKFQLRPRRLVDVSKIDMRCTILGTAYDSPIFICPTASNRAFHPDGEVAVAKAARSGNHLEMLSTVATTSIEEATAARGAPIWFQLYASPRWQIAEALAKRAERAGCPAIVVTIDDLGGRNQETLQRLRRTDTRQCSACHAPGWGYVARKPNYDGLDLSGLSTVLSPNMTWDFIKRLRDTVATKLLLKGIMSHEDARLAAASGIDGIIVSNHGGRSEDSGRSTIDALPEIIEAAGDTMPVLVDSGFRRGTDIVKALALGAKGVGIGRPCLWGLGAFGQEGVERVLELLRAELRVAMQQVGAPSIRDLTPAMVRRA
jgi:isopentenyl diphosphate isomerase/L-lactate dehydrogenase-like FMN-dependent dehydrogenase